MGEEKEPLLEGALLKAEFTAGPSLTRARSSPDLTSLDMLVELDEPEEVILALKRLAEAKPKDDKRWEGVRRLCERAIEYFEVVNRPKPNRPQP